jgi:hypothetical protein
MHEGSRLAWPVLLPAKLAVGRGQQGGSVPSMGAMSMSHGSHTRASMSVGGMKTSIGAHGTSILPSWLAVIWTLVFVAILISHARHIQQSSGQRRIWHSGHVAMAAGMIFMYAPATIDVYHIPSGFWQIAFADGGLAALAWILAQALGGQAVNVLWGLLAIDMGVMVYMWSPSGFVAPVTWTLVAYLVWQSVLWITDRMRAIDHHTLWGSHASVTPGGEVAISAAEPLVCFSDLRVSMFAMTLGMAYMLAAMQLMT